MPCGRMCAANWRDAGSDEISAALGLPRVISTGLDARLVRADVDADTSPE